MRVLGSSRETTPPRGDEVVCLDSGTRESMTHPRRSRRRCRTGGMAKVRSGEVRAGVRGRERKRRRSTSAVAPRLGSSTDSARERGTHCALAAIRAIGYSSLAALPPKTSMRMREWYSAFWQLLRLRIDTISAAGRGRASVKVLEGGERGGRGPSGDARDQFLLSFKRPSWTHETRPTAGGRRAPSVRRSPSGGEGGRERGDALADSWAASASFFCTSWKPASGLPNCLL